METRDNAAVIGADELEAEIAGQKLRVKSLHLNTLATVAILIITCLLAYGQWMHNTDTKETMTAFTNAVKENTVAVREQNCLARFDSSDKPKQADLCKTLAR